MYGSDTALRDMVRSDPATFPPAKTARIPSPREVLGIKKVTLKWLVWWVARGQIEPQEAAWALCPKVEPVTSGFIKLIGHTELVLRRWVGFYQECGYDKGQEDAVKKEVMKIWGLKEDRPCHLRPRR